MSLTETTEFHFFHFPIFGYCLLNALTNAHCSLYSGDRSTFVFDVFNRFSLKVFNTFGQHFGELFLVTPHWRTFFLGTFRYRWIWEKKPHQAKFWAPVQWRCETWTGPQKLGLMRFEYFLISEHSKTPVCFTHFGLFFSEGAIWQKWNGFEETVVKTLSSFCSSGGN